MNIREAAEIVGGTVIGNGETELRSAADLEVAGPGEIAFCEKPSAALPNGACVVVGRNFDAADPENTLIRVDDPKRAFVKIAQILHPQKAYSEERHASAVTSESATIGSGVFLGAFTCVGDNSIIGDGSVLRAGAKVGDNVRIGKNCVLHPNVLVDDNSVIGDNVILYAGVVIGSPGFGYVRDESGEYSQFPQIGKVVIENDVEIGANSCVDRGALGDTVIGAGTKIDNLVQIAHNVRIGRRCVIAAQTGISGSVTIEDECVIGGQVGFGDHVLVKTGAVIGSQAGILPGKIVRPGVWWGTPIQPLDEYKRQNANVKGLGRLKDQVRKLREKLDGIAATEEDRPDDV